MSYGCGCSNEWDSVDQGDGHNTEVVLMSYVGKGNEPTMDNFDIRKCDNRPLVGGELRLQCGPLYAQSDGPGARLCGSFSLVPPLYRIWLRSGGRNQESSIHRR